MNDYYIDRNDLISESDVEQKVIYPLITNIEPLGLGFDSTEIRTKINLQKLLIDKGQKSILYYPDYLISVNGIPSIVIEAKKPDEDLIEAFRQASLYATEINKKFSSGLNPCQLLIACDGIRLIAGKWDSDNPKFNITTENWNYVEKDFNDFCNEFAKSSVENTAKEFKLKLKTRVRFSKPLNIIGGKTIQDRSAQNTFGETVSIQYAHLFNPNDEVERIDVVQNAYVKVAKHEAHITPIDRLIRKKVLPSIIESTQIEDSGNPKELINKLSKAREYNNQLLLLIGGVGSGKSTFATYLKERALGSEIIEKLVWVTLDLNNAPVNANEIYLWVKKQIISQLKEIFNENDFEGIEFIQNLYSEEIYNLKRGALSLLSPEDNKYKEILVEKIYQLQADIDTTLECYIKHLVHKNEKDLVIVLDNCDKRNLEEQLLMFEVASWIKDTIKAIVFLPLRDTTFDHHRRQKPLDTVVKDLIYRITPPSLKDVLYERVKYANRLSEKSESRYYELANGIKVLYPSKEELYYLNSILTSLFQNHFFRRLITGLAGSDIRIGLEIFLDFCKSGYISSNDIFQMKQSHGNFVLPDFIISKVFIRQNRYYYSDANARIKNLFNSDPNDELPDPFIRIAILRWLNDRFRIRGSSGILGFHNVEELIGDLTSLGHSRKRIDSEILTLLRHSLIINESQNINEIDKLELLSINTPGIIHLDLVKNPDYLSSCAEDIWYNVSDYASEIAKNMSDQGTFSRLSLRNVIEHSRIVVNYLEDYYNKYFQIYSGILSEKAFSEPINFKELKEIIERLHQKFLMNKYRKFEVGEILQANITGIMDYGIFVNINNSRQSGLIKKHNIADIDFQTKFKIDDKIFVRINSFNESHQKYDLMIANDEPI